MFSWIRNTVRRSTRRLAGGRDTRKTMMIHKTVQAQAERDRAGASQSYPYGRF